MDFEDILVEVDDFGPFQKRLVYFFLIPSATLLPLFCMTTLFMVSSPDHFCRVSQLSNFSYEEQQKFISPIIEENGIKKHDSCNMYDIDYDLVAKSANLSFIYNNESLPLTKCNDGWVYDNTYYDETAVTAVRIFSYLHSIIIETLFTIIKTLIFGTGVYLFFVILIIK